MFILRKIGKFIRGDATPFQIMSACLLGGVLGFMPGARQAPGLIAFLTFLLVIVNANLFLAGIVLLAGRLFALLLMPLSFYAGRMLIDGPTEGIFTALINAPLTAWFGFENYVATGSLLTGALFGMVCGFSTITLLSSFRRRMAALEEHSETYKTFISRPFVQVLIFVFMGGVKGKKDWSEILKKRIGNPIRPLGAVLVALCLVLLVVSMLFLDELILRNALRSGLERINGATVDLERVELDLAENRLTITGLAMADPNALDTNVFAAERIEADIAGMSLLRKKVAIDRIEIANATHGAQRRVAGVRLIPPTEQARLPTDIPADFQLIEELVKESQVWRDRLAQVRAWLERLSPPEAESTEHEGADKSGTRTLAERLAEQAAAQGYANVRADHLIHKSPTLTIHECVARGLTVVQFPGQTFEINGRELSTHPSLLDTPPSLEIKSQSGDILFSFSGGEISAGSTTNVLTIRYRGLPVDRIAEAVADPGSFPFRGGLLDLEAEGTLTGAILELPVTVTVHDSTLTLPRLGKREISNFTFPMEIRGPIDSPQVKLSPETFVKAAVAVGRSVLKEKISKEAGKLFQKFRQ